jgi:hypothetical protein
MTGLASYWPDSRQIAECIKREAETVSEAVLLAVHQTMPLSVRNAGSPNEHEADEKAFLDAFLARDLPEGVLIQPVTGTSGAGKSHLIRWLDAQLKRDERAKKMVVVRIPKTASLRNVVELILEPLSKDKRFDQAKSDLRRAVEEVTPETASIRLAGGIEIALKELARKLRAKLLADPNGPDAPELTLRLDHARRLPNYLNDPVLEEHFKKDIFSRIIAGSVRAERGHEVDATDRLFSADDLKLPAGIKLGESANAVQIYYSTILMARDGEGFTAAADILNEILDPAIGEVFRLTQSLGGMTLQELILSIRELLLEDRRELVLLIEDFAALSGIQETLLAVCIQEAVRDGRLVRAPMRTAIAITDGYLMGRDTILTRAKRVWQVRTSLGAEDAFESTRALVAAYLNAARWGSKELERRFKASGAIDDLTGWVTPFAEENLSSDDASLLGGFGFGPKNVPLFPYNDAAIRSLARRHLSEGGHVLFKPRSIINFILRDVLECRELFLRGAFPPEKFEEAVAKAEVASWLSKAAADYRGRLESTIVYWGDNPGTLEALSQVPEAIFKAFKLEAPSALGLTPVVAPARTSTPAPTQKAKAEAKAAESVATPAEDPDRKKWSDTLEGWASGQLLQQRDARHLRIPLGELLSKSMNWNALRMSRISAPPPFIIIHNAAGNDAPATYKLQLSKEPGDRDGRLRKGLLAIALYEKNNRSWDYSGGDLDSAAAANLIDRLGRQYAADIETLAHGEIAWLVDQLIVQARVLGHSFRETTKPERVAEIVLGPIEATFADSLVPDSPEERWQQLRQQALRLRSELQTLLLARLGCFQGTGATTYGIDTVRLAKSLKCDAKKPPRDCTQGELGNHISTLKDAFLRARVQPVIQSLRDFSDAVVSTFGKDFDKEEYLREAKALVDSVGSDIWPPNGEPRQALTAAIEEFRKTRLQDTLEKIRRIPEGDLASVSVMDLVSVAGQVDFSVIARTREFIKRVNLFVSGVDQSVAARERTAGDADPTALATAIEQKLDEIATALSTLPEEV